MFFCFFNNNDQLNVYTAYGKANLSSVLATAAASADGNVSDVVVGSGDDYFKY